MMILGLGLSLRLWGIRFGLPYAYHVDEPTYISAALNLGAGIIGKQPNPTAFSNVLFGEYAVYFVIGRLTGLFSSVVDFENAYRADPSVFLLLARLTSVLAGVLTILVIYWTGRVIRNRSTGVIAALILASAFLHARDAHFGVPDVIATFFLSMTIFSAIRATQSSKWRYLWLAGLGAGLTITAKWSFWLILPPLALAAYWRSSQAPAQPLRAWRMVLIGLLVGTLAGGFQLFLKPTAYVDYALREWRSGAAGGFGFWQIDTVPGWIFYLRTLGYGLGVAVLALALVGLGLRIARVVKDRDRSSILLVIFPLFYFIAMGATRHYFARYALPLAPFAAIFAAETIVAFGAWLDTRSPRMGRSLVMGLVLIALIQPLTASIRHGMLLTRTDTRTQAKAWIEQNIPAGAKIAVDWPTHGPPLATAERPAPDSERAYAISLVGGAGLSERSIDWYRGQGYQYLIASSFIYQIPLVFQEQDQERKAFYASLEREFTEIQTFHPTGDGSEPAFIFDEVYGPAISLWQRKQPGPTLRIYQVSDSAPLGRNEQ
jgi:hypothetical protein